MTHSMTLRVLPPVCDRMAAAIAAVPRLALLATRGADGVPVRADARPPGEPCVPGGVLSRGGVGMIGAEVA